MHTHAHPLSLSHTHTYTYIHKQIHNAEIQLKREADALETFYTFPRLVNHAGSNGLSEDGWGLGDGPRTDVIRGHSILTAPQFTQGRINTGITFLPHRSIGLGEDGWGLGMAPGLM